MVKARELLYQLKEYNTSEVITGTGALMAKTERASNARLPLSSHTPRV